MLYRPESENRAVDVKEGDGVKILRKSKRSRVMEALCKMDGALEGLSDNEKLQAISLLKRSFELEMLNKVKATDATPQNVEEQESVCAKL